MNALLASAPSTTTAPKNAAGRPVASIDTPAELFGVTLRLLTYAVGLSSAATATSSSPLLFAKLHVYIRFLTATFGPSGSSIGLPTLQASLTEIFAVIENAVASEKQITIQDVVGALAEILALSNSLNGDVRLIVLQKAKELLVRKPILAQAMLVAGFKSIANVVTLSSFAETCAEQFFVGSTQWALLISSLQVPEIDQGEFIAECLKSGAVLILYAYCNQLLHANSRDEKAIMAVSQQLLDWIEKVQLPQGQQHKIFLLWMLAIQTIAGQLASQQGGGADSAALLLRLMANMEQSIASDSQGFFGSLLSWGQKSLVTANPFHVATRLLLLFLSCQAGEGFVRISPNDPMNILAQKKGLNDLAQIAKSLQGQQSSTDYLHCASLLKEFISDSGKTLQSTGDVVFLLLSRMFPNARYFTEIGKPHVQYAGK
eukprot:TRINITY_DN1022_c0_g1_i1.p1 TRINITY_DN1022_c0_g1~~TRINITY_DN1022_c0_g1_i1.p1  ORF type:complete len:430 (-),score=75.93 TRINITY_DN1022_c0_g1_i1:1-1290(-)